MRTTSTASLLNQVTGGHIGKAAALLLSENSSETYFKEWILRQHLKLLMYKMVWGNSCFNYDSQRFASVIVPETGDERFSSAVADTQPYLLFTKIQFQLWGTLMEWLLSPCADTCSRRHLLSNQRDHSWSRLFHEEGGHSSNNSRKAGLLKAGANETFP